MNHNNQYKPPAPPEPPKPPEEKDVDKSRKTQLILSIAIALLVLGGLTAIFLIRQNTGPNISAESKDSVKSFLPFLPVWIAVFIPILVKKNKMQTQPHQKRILIITVIAMIILVLAGISAWMYYAYK